MINKEILEMMKKYFEMYKTVGTKTVEGDPEFLAVARQEYQLAMGETIIRDHVVKTNSTGSAAIVLPITKEGNFVLVIQPRVLTESGVGIEVPSGYIEPGEDSLTAARRELEEETGYTASEFVPLSAYYQDQGCMQAFNHSFIAWDCEKTRDQRLDFDEHIQYFECTPSEAWELVEMGYINDANSLLALAQAKTLLKERLYETSNSQKRR